MTRTATSTTAGIILGLLLPHVAPAAAADAPTPDWCELAKESPTDMNLEMCHGVDILGNPMGHDYDADDADTRG